MTWMGGLQLFVLGMLGEYLWRVADEVRQRPLFLVQELTGDFSRLIKMRNNIPLKSQIFSARE